MTAGHPALRERAREITAEELSAPATQALIDDLIETMRAAGGAGLAANQIAQMPRIAVIEVDHNPRYPYKPPIPLTVIVNPVIEPLDDELFAVNEGCLSIPGLSWDIVRPNAVHLVGLDLDGNEFSIEATELEGRIFQHELDHLDGILLVERLDADQRKEAMKILRGRTLHLPAGDLDGLSSLFSR